jgi:hypothetical protein
MLDAPCKDSILFDNKPACHKKNVPIKATIAAMPASIAVGTFLLAFSLLGDGTAAVWSPASVATTMGFEQTGQGTDRPAAAASTTSLFPQCGHLKLISRMIVR